MGKSGDGAFDAVAIAHLKQLASPPTAPLLDRHRDDVPFLRSKHKVGLSLDNHCVPTYLAQASHMARRSHPRRDIEAAIRYAEAHGWTVETGGAHAWGRMYCPWNDDACRCGEFCITSIWSTPRNAVTHGRQLQRVVDNCLHLRTQH